MKSVYLQKRKLLKRPLKIDRYGRQDCFAKQIATIGDHSIILFFVIFQKIEDTTNKPPLVKQHLHIFMLERTVIKLCFEPFNFYDLLRSDFGQSSPEVGLDVHFTLVIHLHILFSIFLLTFQHIALLSNFIHWREIHRRALKVGKLASFYLLKQVFVAGVIVPEHIGLRKKSENKLHKTGLAYDMKNNGGEIEASLQVFPSS